MAKHPNHPKECEGDECFYQIEFAKIEPPKKGPCEHCQWNPKDKPDDEDRYALCHPCMWGSLRVDNFMRIKKSLRAPAKIETAGHQLKLC
jgi:hypothetical protein